MTGELPHSLTGGLLYLDPGTGSLLFSAVFGIAATAFFVVKGLIYRGKAGLLKLAGGGVDAAPGDHGIVLYSEGRQYAGTFAPIVAELIRRGVPCTYMSSDKDDPVLQAADRLVTTQFIGSGYAAWARLNNLHADVCAMTTPGLDVLQIKRSKHVKYYANIVHSPTDKSFNRPYSFDYFDSVLVCGPHQIRTLRTLEQLRGSRAKECFLVGCAYYDALLAKYRHAGANRFAIRADAPRVLVAPTWGRNGLLARYGMDLIRPLLEAGFRVTIRPHPQSRISEANMLDQIEIETRPFANCSWDNDSDSIQAMVDSDILVSDISGIVFDYAFLTGKPVITIEFAVSKVGFEANDLPYEPWDIEVLDRVGCKLPAHDVERLPDVIRREVGNQSRADEVRTLREEFVVNFGDTAPRIVDVLEELLFRLHAPHLEKSVSGKFTSSTAR
jgi:hypothetical protein